MRLSLSELLICFMLPSLPGSTCQALTQGFCIDYSTDSEDLYIPAAGLSRSHRGCPYLWVMHGKRNFNGYYLAFIYLNGTRAHTHTHKASVISCSGCLG